MGCLGGQKTSKAISTYFYSLIQKKSKPEVNLRSALGDRTYPIFRPYSLPIGRGLGKTLSAQQAIISAKQ